MLFKRKIYSKFLDWKNETKGQKALLVEGARRIGKSTVVEEFARNEYKSYILIDFAKAPEDVKDYFRLHLDDLDTFYMLLSVQYGVQLYPRESIIIFDEVQMFPKAREAIKYLVADGRYDFMETGSLISIKENVKDIVIPSEERHIRMYPLDFEEFCWALGEKPLIQWREHRKPYAVFLRERVKTVALNPAVKHSVGRLIYDKRRVKLLENRHNLGGLRAVVVGYADIQRLALPYRVVKR